ncbi:SH3 domain-containing protein [Allomuricauda sp. SCSIO 65647]|uniref:SH3 domain-containing protein n=1 Tax=Allomuricauda sp. SCSIO 65647 TaxID=2908843 RepID=UPI001F2B448F|nr:SH3 domain-containing protein [Muricauda sp. SCSIO 65647]UJH66458.1 SH3 domain-containing protein [Muricauda sp. SCSIO 65647]
MKTKQMLSILTLLAICLFTNAQEKLHCLDGSCSFEPGQIVYLFGDQVQLRVAPTREAKVLKTLPIGMHMVIQERHENSWRYKGVDSHYYKVDYKGTEGYVLGGLLALEKKTINDVVHLFGRGKIGEEDQLVIRTLQEDGSFKEKSIRLGNGQFYLTDLGTKGLPDVDGILLIDYVAEGCGIEGGGIYLFQQGKVLHQVARLSQVSDAGAYYFWEEFIFPEDKHGVAGKIRYKKEIGEYYDEMANWKKTSVETKELVWVNNNLGLAQQ